MQPSRADLADFLYFLAIARHRSFRKAAIELNVSTSALSHAMSSLEARRGIRLLNRSTRAVTLTAAGEDLRATIEEPIGIIRGAIERLDRLRDAPAGRIRISVPGDAVPLLIEPVLPVFIARYPGVEIDISVSNRMIDVIESGFDAGIRYGGTVPEDMIALRLSPDICWMSAAAPDYLAREGIPETPQALAGHRCIRIRLGNSQIYDWEFERDGACCTIAAAGPITVDDSQTAISLARQGAGILYGAEPVLRPSIEAGTLIPVLAPWSSIGGGFHIYYSGRRQVPNALRLLIALFRELDPMGQGRGCNPDLMREADPDSGPGLDTGSDSGPGSGATTSA